MPLRGPIVAQHEGVDKLVQVLRMAAHIGGGGGGFGGGGASGGW